MSNQKPRSREFTDSDYEVRFAARHEEEMVDIDTRTLPFYDRLAKLGIWQGTHFLRAGSLDKNIDMLVQDFPQNEHVREAIIMRDSLIHYYAFDTARGNIMQIAKNLRVNDKGHVVETAGTPTYVFERNEPCTEVSRCIGEEYQRWLYNRVVALDLLSEDSAAEAFVEDTDVFVRDTRLRSQPTVAARITRSPQA